MNRKVILTPPVITPSEVPAGAFLLGSGLAARGIQAPIHDLSLDFFYWLFTEEAPRKNFPNCTPSLEYLKKPRGGLYNPHSHRSHSGVLQSVLKRYSKEFPGWHLSLMDSVPPWPVHSTSELLKSAQMGNTPFSVFLRRWIAKQRDTFDHALVSLSYISQLPATIELVWLLQNEGKEVIVGGSLPTALRSTGTGIHLLEKCFSTIRYDDGRSFSDDQQPLLSRLKWPVMVSEHQYLSSRLVMPYPLSTGCIWNRCLFCPDRGKDFYAVPVSNLSALLREAPEAPLVHFIDSALPVEGLASSLAVLRDMANGFYGFARPDASFGDDTFLDLLEKAGCLMLQTGVESGSSRLLRRYAKGFSPATAERAVKGAHLHGIRNYIYLLFGLPEETDQDRLQTLNLVERIAHAVDYMNISVFNLPVKSELTDRASEFGIIPGEYDGDSEVLRFYRPFIGKLGEDPRNAARSFLQNVFRNSSSVAEILQNTPKWFRAGHMALTERISPVS